MKIEYPRISFEIIKRIFHLSHHYPTKVQIEITNRCNFNCHYCPKNDYKLDERDMEFSYFKEIMQKITESKVIIPVGWGESLLHPDFHKIIDYIKCKNHEIKFVTNGYFLDLNSNINTLLKVDYLTVSIDTIKHNNKSNGHNNGAKVFEKLAYFIQQRENRKPFITVQSVMFAGNNELLHIAEKSVEMDVERFNIVRPYTKFNKSIDIPWKKRLPVYKQLENFGKKQHFRIDMFEYASFEGIKRFLWKYFKNIFRINQWCPRLYDFIYITIDGYATPCCELPRYIVGNLNLQTIREIWNSKEMKRFRKDHRKICSDCQILKLK